MNVSVVNDFNHFIKGMRWRHKEYDGFSHSSLLQKTNQNFLAELIFDLIVQENKIQNMQENQPYIIPDGTRIGHIHLKVAHLERALAFYCDLLGFTLVARYGEDAAFVSAGGYHHHIGLNTWYSKDAAPPPKKSTGLFHTAIVFPERRDLAIALQRLLDVDYPLTGAADHGVSEALYLNDPDQNGVELYWDRPQDQWPRNARGGIEMYTHRLDLGELLKELS